MPFPAATQGYFLKTKAEPKIDTLGSVQYLPMLLIEDTAVGGNSHHAPRDEFPAVHEGTLHGVFDTAATRHLHANDSDTSDIVLGNDRRELVGVIPFVQLGIIEFQKNRFRLL